MVSAHGRPRARPGLDRPRRLGEHQPRRAVPDRRPPRRRGGVPGEARALLRGSLGARLGGALARRREASLQQRPLREGRHQLERPLEGEPRPRRGGRGGRGGRPGWRGAGGTRSRASASRPPRPAPPAAPSSSATATARLSATTGRRGDARRAGRRAATIWRQSVSAAVGRLAVHGGDGGLHLVRPGLVAAQARPHDAPALLGHGRGPRATGPGRPAARASRRRRCGPGGGTR